MVMQVSTSLAQFVTPRESSRNTSPAHKFALKRFEDEVGQLELSDPLICWIRKITYAHMHNLIYLVTLASSALTGFYGGVKIKKYT